LLEIVYTSRFKKDAKRIQRRGKDVRKLYVLIDALANDIPLPKKMRDHALRGNYTYHRECHIEPDWLLIYKISDGVLQLERTGSHADLFE
jgi:mRNA interferase YafQ